MHYTIYKTVNKINGKIYIGKHQTKNLEDGYLGSGKYLMIAIQKHGIENFEKEILYVFDNEQEMNDKEKELVTKEFCKEDTNYNLCPGGHGGFGYINCSGLRTKNHTPEMYNNISKKLKGRKRPGAGANFKEFHENANPSDYITSGMTGKQHSEESKRKMSEKSKGKNNSQYGTRWITNGIVSKRIPKNQTIPDGWDQGRT